MSAASPCPTCANPLAYEDATLTYVCILGHKWTASSLAMGRQAAASRAQDDPVWSFTVNDPHTGLRLRVAGLPDPNREWPPGVIALFWPALEVFWAALRKAGQ